MGGGEGAGSEILAEGGLLSGNLIGVDVLAPEVDPEADFVNVRTRNNTSDFDEREVRVPTLRDVAGE